MVAEQQQIYTLKVPGPQREIRAGDAPMLLPLGLFLQATVVPARIYGLLALLVHGLQRRNILQWLILGTGGEFDGVTQEVP